MYMLTDFNVPALVCKWVFYRPEHHAKGGPMELSFEGLEMQNEIYQRIGLKK